MESKTRLSEQLAEKVLYGIRKAVRKLIEETAAQNGSLVIERDGAIVTVPAKELLQKQVQAGKKG